MIAGVSRTNHWLLTNTPLTWTYQIVPTVDLRKVEQQEVWQRLITANPQENPLEILLPSFWVEWACRLYHEGSSPIQETEDRQFLSLLLNHHAAVHTGQVQYFFGHQDEENVVDVFGVGTTRPRLWVLGERVNPKAKSFPLPFGTVMGRGMLWPFLNPWISRLSNVLQPEETRLQARRRLIQEHRALGEPMVLLLGNVAGKVWHGPNVLGYLEHPQYIWRFHHEQIPQWVSQFDAFQRWAAEGRG